MKRMSPNAFNLFFLRSWKWSEICQDLILEKEEKEEKESSSEKDQGIEKPDLSKQIDALLFLNFSQIIQKNIFWNIWLIHFPEIFKLRNFSGCVVVGLVG